MAWPAGMSKDEWGPRGWNWLHLQAINYDPKERKKTRARIDQFISSLPCPVCRQHAQKYIARRPPTLDSSLAFQTWVWAFHNDVNDRLGKPIKSYSEYRRDYGDEIMKARLHLSGER